MENPQKNIFVPILVVVITLAVIGIGVFQYRKNVQGPRSPLDAPLSTTTPPINPGTTTPSGINPPAPKPTTPPVKPVTPPSPKPAAFTVSPIAFQGSSPSSTHPTISWATSVPTKTKVFYDKQEYLVLFQTKPGEFQGSDHGYFVLNTSLSPSHLFEFPGLDLSTKYYYAIEALDQYGNSVVTTGSFTTPATRGN